MNPVETFRTILIYIYCLKFEIVSCAMLLSACGPVPSDAGDRHVVSWSGRHVEELAKP